MTGWVDFKFRSEEYKNQGSVESLECFVRIVNSITSQGSQLKFRLLRSRFEEMFNLFPTFKI